MTNNPNLDNTLVKWAIYVRERGFLNLSDPDSLRACGSPDGVPMYSSRTAAQLAVQAGDPTIRRFVGIETPIKIVPVTLQWNFKACPNHPASNCSSA